MWNRSSVAVTAAAAAPLRRPLTSLWRLTAAPRSVRNRTVPWRPLASSPSSSSSSSERHTPTPLDDISYCNRKGIPPSRVMLERLVANPTLGQSVDIWRHFVDVSVKHGRHVNHVIAPLTHAMAVGLEPTADLLDKAIEMVRSETHNRPRKEVRALLEGIQELDKLPLDMLERLLTLARIADEGLSTLRVASAVHEATKSDKRAHEAVRARAYNAMLFALFRSQRAGTNEKFLQVYEHMTEEGVVPDETTYGYVMAQLSRAKPPRTDDVLAMYNDAGKHGIPIDVTMTRALVRAFSEMMDGLQLLASLEQSGVEVTGEVFQTLITKANAKGQHDEALKLYLEMRRRSLPVTALTCVQLLSHSWTSDVSIPLWEDFQSILPSTGPIDAESSVELALRAFKQALPSNEAVAEALQRVRVKSSKERSALSVLQLEKLHAMGRHKQVRLAAVRMHDMGKRGLHVALKSVSGELEEAAYMRKNRLMDLHKFRKKSKLRVRDLAAYMSELWKVARAQGVPEDGLTYRYAAVAYARLGDFERMMEMVERMTARGASPAAVQTMLRELMAEQRFDMAVSVLRRACDIGAADPKHVQSLLFYVFHNKPPLMEMVERLFDVYERMVSDEKAVIEPDATTCNLCLSTLARCVPNADASALSDFIMKVFVWMTERGILPDGNGYNAIIWACDFGGDTANILNVFDAMKSHPNGLKNLSKSAVPPLMKALSMTGRVQDIMSLLDLHDRPAAESIELAIDAALMANDTALVDQLRQRFPAGVGNRKPEQRMPRPPGDDEDD